MNVWVVVFSFGFHLFQATCIAALHTFTSIPIANQEREREWEERGGLISHLVRLEKAHRRWVIGRPICSFLGWQIVWHSREYC